MQTTNASSRADFDEKVKETTHLLTKTNSRPGIEGNKDERVLSVVLRSFIEETVWIKDLR